MSSLAAEAFAALAGVRLVLVLRPRHRPSQTQVHHHDPDNPEMGAHRAQPSAARAQSAAAPAAGMFGSCLRRDELVESRERRPTSGVGLCLSPLPTEHATRAVATPSSSA